MLANSFDTYEVMSRFCNDPENGFTELVTGKNGTFKQVRPEYTIMKNEYANIIKNSSKYGISPGDRHRIFKGLKVKTKKDPTAGI